MDGAGWTGRGDIRKLNCHWMPKCLMAEAATKVVKVCGHQAQIVSVQSLHQWEHVMRGGRVRIFFCSKSASGGGK